MERSSLIGVIVAILLALPWSIASAGGDNTSIWRKPTPGTAAFLGDDGGDENGATICDTAAHFRDWLDDDHHLGCKKFPRGLRAVIDEVVSYDPTKYITDAIVKITIPSAHFTGYLQLERQIRPAIPKGAIVHFKKDVSATMRLAPSQDSGLDIGQDIGDQATAKVIRYDPSTGDRGLYVTVMDGIAIGKSGWMFVSEAEDGDGQPVGSFDREALKTSLPLAPEQATEASSGEHSNQVFACKSPVFAQEIMETFNPILPRGIQIVDVMDQKIADSGKMEEAACHVTVQLSDSGYQSGVVVIKPRANWVDGTLLEWHPDGPSRKKR
jgi:hypothetical protein